MQHLIRQRVLRGKKQKKMNGPQKSQEDEPGIKLATQKGGKNNNREVIIRYDLLFAILWGVYLLFFFVFFPDKKKEKREIC